jgi:hypothetical protein
MSPTAATAWLIAGLVVAPWAAVAEADTKLFLSVTSVHGHDHSRQLGLHQAGGHHSGGFAPSARSGGRHDSRQHDRGPHHPRHHSGHVGHHHHASKTVVIVPSAPVYYVPSPSGYWSYQWVPRWAPVQVWVPGAWSADGRWVESHYETRWADYGAWQPYWVPY